MQLLGISILFALTASSFCATIPKVIDLTYTYNNETPNYPLHDQFKLIPVLNTVEKYGVWIGINNLCTSEHSGTHMDAPQHFIQKARTVDDIDPAKLYRRPGVKIDISHKIEDDVNYPVSRADIEEWIQEHGPIPDGAFVIFETGYWNNSQDPLFYSGLDEAGTLNFPSLGESAGRFLVEYKEANNLVTGIVGVGLDVLSLDVGNSSTFPVHYDLLRNDIYGIENIANINILPPKGFYVTLAPMKIGHGSGGPTRVFAEIPPKAARF